MQKVTVASVAVAMTCAIALVSVQRLQKETDSIEGRDHLSSMMESVALTF